MIHLSDPAAYHDKRFKNNPAKRKTMKTPLPTPVNARVKIRQGVLMNYQGLLLEVTGNKASLKIESMGLQLTAVFDKSNLEVLEEKKK